jgi:hypothetical protein
MDVLEFLKKLDNLKKEFTYFKIWCNLEIFPEKAIPRIQQINIILKIGDYEYQNNHRYESYGHSPDIFYDFTEALGNIEKFIAKTKAKQAIDLI